MFKKYNVALLLVLFTFIGIESSQIAFTFTLGPPAGYTGESSEFTCSDGPGCHAGTASVNPLMADFIITDDNGALATYYIPGATYTITVDINGAPAGGCYGFQILNIDPTGTTVGTYNAVSGTKIISSGTRTYLEHDTPSASGDWVFTWTAPNVYLGPIDWFMGANASNCDGLNTGDIIYTASQSMAEPPACPLNMSLVYPLPNILFFECEYSTDEPRLRVKLSDFSGPGAPYSLSALAGELSATIAYPGDTIDYFFTQYELDNALTLITLGNSSGDCAPFADVFINFQGYPIDLFCTDSLQCSSNIILNYPVNNAQQPLLNCDLTNTMLEFSVSSVTGGSGLYVLSSSGGTVSPNVVSAGLGFTYTISQADIDAYNTILYIDDLSGCTKTVDLRGQLNGALISDICYVCPDILNENSQSAITTDQTANFFISSNGKVTSSSVVEYKAGIHVELLPHFEVELGAEFDAYIQGCD